MAKSTHRRGNPWYRKPQIESHGEEPIPLIFGKDGDFWSAVGNRIMFELLYLIKYTMKLVGSTASALNKRKE